MKYLIVGLGNIGPEYELTRHNIGFLTLDRLADAQNCQWSSERLAFKTEFKFRGRQIHLIKPTTYMNLSGKAMNYWMKELKIPKENTLVVVDEVALPFESLRMRAKGSAAGHNGLKNIELLTGGSNYPRLRMGIGNDFPKGRQVDFVLGKFTEDEFAVLPTMMDRAIEMIYSFCTIGIQDTMSKYNN
ncbi:aminoacyl-tRNA hydrolase [Algoriphagus sediminis]|uniref:Peptidyl-tRNA hydrolase n=1 Tax=Algoriphagus sediminis TaxID=3057113 RepID=A0ABT7YGX4_9BACT|nr:aminoacyl-tRNA hydrolase [Algoriphagus sediminis]MDN3205736.1 aminoacyl-tRNA hydrolase [Algoriphagus sediminis]